MNIPSPNYLAVDDQVLSIARLRQLFDVGRVPAQFFVGGRFHQSSFGACLASAQGNLKLPSNLNFMTHDLVVVQARAEHLSHTGAELFLSQVVGSQTVFYAKNSTRPEFKFEGHTAKLWAQFLFATREFFNQQGLLEVMTPYLVQNPGMEPELEPFLTHWKAGSKTKACFLPTSPELHIKQMMVQGFTDLYEIKTAFRNEELTNLHQPEFSMLEWYRGFSNLVKIENDLMNYLEFLANSVFEIKFNLADVKKIKVSDLFRTRLDFDLTPQTSQADLLKLAIKLELYPAQNSSWNDLFHLIWVAKIEQNLPRSPFLLSDYPPSQAALARLNSRGWADRFEFYWQGYEIANAFHELNDPVEQRLRFENDQKRRLEYGRTPLEIDENFMKALYFGLPPSGGIALGLDRLFMAFSGIQKISEARAFTF